MAWSELPGGALSLHRIGSKCYTKKYSNKEGRMVIEWYWSKFCSDRFSELKIVNVLYLVVKPTIHSYFYFKCNSLTKGLSGCCSTLHLSYRLLMPAHRVSLIQNVFDKLEGYKNFSYAAIVWLPFNRSKAFTGNLKTAALFVSSYAQCA